MNSPWEYLSCVHVYLMQCLTTRMEYNRRGEWSSQLGSWYNLSAETGLPCPALSVCLSAPNASDNSPNRRPITPIISFDNTCTASNTQNDRCQYSLWAVKVMMDSCRNIQVTSESDTGQLQWPAGDKSCGGAGCQGHRGRTLRRPGNVWFDQHNYRITC